MKNKFVSVVVIIAVVVFSATMYYGLQIGEFIFKDFEPRETSINHNLRGW